MDTPSVDEILKKLERFCAYQERCVFDVRQKLCRMEVSVSIQDKIISSLISEGFVNDKRFAGLYVRSKVNQKGWGRMRLKAELRRRNIDPVLIEEALCEFHGENEEKILISLLQKKQKEIVRYPVEKQREKLIRYAIGKGYTINTIFEALKSTGFGSETEQSC